jgi:hypothetical protein
VSERIEVLAAAQAATIVHERPSVAVHGDPSECLDVSAPWLVQVVKFYESMEIIMRPKLLQAAAKQSKLQEQVSNPANCPAFG